MSDIRIWPDLVRAVDADNGVLQINMEILRRLEGAKKLDAGPRERIASQLREMGLGHIPRELPRYAGERVLLYRNGTMAAEVIRAIMDGLSGSIGETAAMALRSVNETGSGDSEDVDHEEVARAAQEAQQAAADAARTLKELQDRLAARQGEAPRGRKRGLGLKAIS